MKQTFFLWAHEQVAIKGNTLRSVKGPPPFPMFYDDGTPVEQINLKWINNETGEEFVCEYEETNQHPTFD